MRRWTYAAALMLVCPLVVVTSLPAGAQSVDVIIDSSSIDLKPADNGEHTAEVLIINTTASRIQVVPTIPDGDQGCTVSAEPAGVEMGRRTSVELTLSSGCNVSDGIDVMLSFEEGVTPPEIELHANPPSEADPDWTILPLAAAISAFGVLGVAGWLRGRVRQLNEEAKGPKETAARIAQRQVEMRRRNVARLARGLTAAGDEPWTENSPTIKWGTELTALGTDWSFKDAWVANVTLGATALVALLATSDVLEAVLGDKPESALALITVAAACAAVLVGLGPLILKAIGKETGIPTVGGTIVAGVVVLFGSLLQIAAITIQATRLTGSPGSKTFLAVGGLATAWVVALYGARSLGGFLAEGIKKPPAETASEIRAAWIIAKAIRPELKELELTPLDISEILAEDPEVQAQFQAEVASVAAIQAGTTRRMARRTALL